MRARETLQIGAPRHAAIFVENFDYGCRRFEAGQPRKITACFRMPGTIEYTTRLRHEREYVPRLA